MNHHHNPICLFSLGRGLTALVGLALAVPAFAFDFPDGLVLRLSSDLTLDDDRVTSWNDSSGSGNNATGGTSPLFVPGATPTGGGVVRFDGSNNEHLMVGANPADFDGGHYTAYAAFRPEAFNQGRIINSAYLDANPDEPGDQSNYAMWGMMAGPNSTQNFRLQARSVDGTSVGFRAAGTPNNSVTLGEFYIGGGTWDSSTGTLTAIIIDSLGNRQTGTETGANAVPEAHLFTRVGAGSSTGNDTLGAPYTGDIAEILIFNRVLTESEMAAVENHLYTTHIPEPGAYAVMLALAAAGAVAWHRRRKTA